jgi:hypothetical protein
MFIKDFLYNYIVPPGIVRLSHKLTKTKKETQKTISNIDDLFAKNKKFKNMHQGERCFILATGPSIKSQNLTILEKELTISVGSFFLHDEINKIKPSYHVLAPCHPPFDFNTLNKIFLGFKNSFKQTKEPHVFMGINNYEFSYKEFLAKNEELNPKSNSFVNFEGSKELNENNYNEDEIWDLSKTPFSLRTVIYLGIQLAVYMGCREIYLLGCDHDYISDTSRTTNHHFYADDKSYSDKEHLDSFSTENWFLEYYMRWKHYRLMKEYCIKKGIKIYNSTDGGLLDVFKRKSLEKILEL